jgi:putative membrane protein
MKLTIAAASLLVLAAGCSPTAGPANDSAIANDSAAAPTPPPVAKSPAQAFADATASGDSFEAAAGTLAAEKATSPALKAWGTKMMREHVTSTMKLKLAAAKVPGILVDATLSPEQTANLKTLQDATGPAFDAAYKAQNLASLIALHKMMVDYAAKGDDETLRGFATENEMFARRRLTLARTL